MRTYICETTTTNVEAIDIVPLAKKCIENIKKLRNRIDQKYLEECMKTYNSKWVNRLFKRKLHDLVATDKYVNDFWNKESENTWHMINCPYPALSYIELENKATEIIRNFDFIGGNPAYTIPIDIYNEIAEMANRE